MDPRLALIGLVVGFLVGLSGVGGSSLMTPLMILVLGVKPLIAVGTDLAYSVPTKLLGAYVHRGQGTVDRRTVLYLSLGGIPAAVTISGPTGTRRPPAALSRASSESGRNRLAATSIAASSPSTARRAAAMAPGSVTSTLTVVPRAGKEIEASEPVTSRPRRRDGIASSGTAPGPGAAAR